MIHVLSFFCLLLYKTFIFYVLGFTGSSRVIDQTKCLLNCVDEVIMVKKLGNVRYVKIAYLIIVISTWRLILSLIEYFWIAILFLSWLWYYPWLRKTSVTLFYAPSKTFSCMKLGHPFLVFLYLQSGCTSRETTALSLSTSSVILQVSSVLLHFLPSSLSELLWCFCLIASVTNSIAFFTF